MYAIVEIAGQQFKVAKDQKVFVHRLPNEEGQQVLFDKVLLIGDGDNITLGAPAIEGAQVGAKILNHLKGDKVIVFKKKRRKGYRVKRGHRQQLSEIVIENIVASGASPTKKEEKSKPAETKAPAKKAVPKKAASKEVAPKEAPAKKAASKEVAPKETPAKKAAPKKAASKEVAPKETPAKKAASKEVAPKKAAPKKAAPKKTAKADDLKKIEGIGPKSAEALVAAGVDTFAKLAKLKPEAISEILTEASSTLAHLVPGTWPEQAQMAADGKWEELQKWQDELDGGIDK